MQEDIERAHLDLNISSFRFSFEWARIEPVRGEIDEAAIARYHSMLVREAGRHKDMQQQQGHQHYA